MLYVKERLSFQQRFSIQRKKWYVMHLTLPWDLTWKKPVITNPTQKKAEVRDKLEEPITSRNNTTSDKTTVVC